MTQQPEPPRGLAWAAEIYGRADAVDGRRRRDYVLFPGEDQGQLRDIYRATHFEARRHGAGMRPEVSANDRYSAEAMLRGVDSLETLEDAGQRDASFRLNPEVTSAAVSEAYQERQAEIRKIADTFAKAGEDFAKEQAGATDADLNTAPSTGDLWLRMARKCYDKGENPTPEEVLALFDAQERELQGAAQTFLTGRVEAMGDGNARRDARIAHLDEQVVSLRQEVAALRERLGLEEKIRRDRDDREKKRLSWGAQVIDQMNVIGPARLTAEELLNDLRKRIDAVEKRAQTNADTTYRVAAAGAENDRGLRRALKKVRRQVRKLRGA